MKTNHDILAGAFPETPQEIDRAIGRAVANIHADERAAHAHRGRRVVALVLVIVLLLGAVAYAVYEGLTANLFGWFYGASWKQELQSGDQAIVGLSKQLGDVVYAIEEVVYKKEGDYQGLYGTIRIRPAEGSNIVLLPIDFSVNQPAGYILHGKPEDLPEGAKSYAELALERNTKIIMAKASVKSISVDGKERLGSYGELWLPQQDGSIVGMMEITENMTRSESYELMLSLSNWEVTPEGDHLREEPENTWLREEWQVTIHPDIKEEET